MTYTGNRRSIGFRKPQRGDVVVIKTKGYYYNEGDLGIIVDTNDQVVPDHCQVQNENEGNSWVVLKHNELEIIDHDEDLLKDPDGQETKTIEPLDLPGGKHSWLLALDVSASMNPQDTRQFIANHLDELKFKVAETVTFDVGITNKYMGMPSILQDLTAGRNGTSVEVVLGHALVRGIQNVLLFSDGTFGDLPRNDQRLNLLIVKTPDGKPEQILFDEHLPLEPHVVETPANPSTKIIRTVFKVEHEGYSWVVGHVLNGKSLHLVRICRHCEEKKSIALEDIKF